LSLTSEIVGRSKKELGWSKLPHTRLLIAASFVAAIVLIVTFGLSDLLYSTVYLENFVPGLLAGFIGVFLALALDQWNSDQREMKEVEKIQQELIEELDDICEALNDDVLFEVVPTVSWHIANSTGLAAKLDDEIRYSIYRAYNSVELHNRAVERMLDYMRRSDMDESTARMLENRYRDLKQFVVAHVEEVLAKHGTS